MFCGGYMEYLRVLNLQFDKYHLTTNFDETAIYGVLCDNQEIRTQFYKLLAGINKSKGEVVYKERNVFDNSEYFHQRLFLDFKNKYLKTMNSKEIKENFKISLNKEFDEKLFKKAVENVNLRSEVKITNEYIFSDLGNTLLNFCLFKGLNYQCSDTNIATIYKGVITAKTSGIAYITVTSDKDSEIEKTLKVIVKEIVSKSISVTPSTGITKDENDKLCIKEGESSKIKVKLDSNATIKTYTFTSSNPEVAKINPDGVIEAISAGTTKITIETTDKDFANITDGEIASTTVTFEITVKALTLKDSIKNFSYWVRKSFGHFGAFLVLGIFAALTFIILTPKSLLAKITALIACLVSGFAVAGITELCQLPKFTTGRYCAFSDVLLDFRGYSYSVIAIFAIVIVIYSIKLLVKFIKNNKKTKNSI